MKEKVSIIVPIFNAQLTLKKCIDSIIKQSYQNFELLLVDDGSTDKSYNICKEYSKKDKRIKIFKKENQGVSHTRNYGIKNAQGKFICFIDSDDVVDKSMLDLLINNQETHNTDLVLAAHRTILSSGTSIKEHATISFVGSIEHFLENIEKFIENESIQGPCAKLFKRDIIIDNKILFPQEMSYGEDTMFVYRYLLYCSRISSLDNTVYMYIKNNQDSLSTVYRKDKFEVFKMLYKELNNLFENYKINNTGLVEKRICIAAISCINEIIEKEKHINERKRAINEILNEEVTYYFKTYDKTLQGKIISFLDEKKVRNGNYLYFMLKLQIIKLKKKLRNLTLK